MRFLSIAALALVGAVMTGCSSEDNVIDQAQTATKNNVVTQTVTVGFDEQAATRALAIDYTNKKLTKTFKANDQIAVIYQNTNDELVKKTVTITDADITAEGKSAKFTVSMTDPKENGTLKYIYPAAMAGETDVDYTKLNTQDGTLASLASKYDLATFEGTLTAAKELPASASLTNKLAILALTFKNSEGTSPLTGINKMTLSDGTNIYTITGKDTDGHIYAAIQPTTAFSCIATDGTNNYAKSLTGKNYAANTIYDLGLKMTEAPSVIEVTTFSELQTALSAGKDVKLMNDIVCTAEIEITSDGALTIDGNGKTLSTTSAIRAFKVKSSATVAFKNLTLTGFVSGGSPAINNNGGTIVLDGCTISNCHVSGGQGGGAIENKGGGKLYAINTTFSGNYSGEIGGAINNYGGSLYMSDCTFTNNYTTSSNAFYGGAIGINGGSEVRLINCAFSGNKYGTNTGNNDIGVYSKPTNDNYTIAGCTGVTIASGDGDITTNASGTATLDYSDLSNISFTYTPVTVTWNSPSVNGSPYTQDGVTLTTTNDAALADCFYERGDKTFTTTLGKFTKIEIVCESTNFDGWTKETVGQYQPIPDILPDYWEDIYKLTWTGDAESVTIPGKYVYQIHSITFTIQ